MFTLPSASRLLLWSDVIYVVGAVLTLGSAAMVLYEKQSKSKGLELRWGLLTEIVLILAAFISLTGTVGAICFGNMVSHLKNVDSATQIAGARAQAIDSLNKAVAAQLEIDKLKPTVSTLQSDQRRLRERLAN